MEPQEPLGLHPVGRWWSARDPQMEGVSILGKKPHHKSSGFVFWRYQIKCLEYLQMITPQTTLWKEKRRTERESIHSDVVTCTYHHFTEAIRWVTWVCWFVMHLIINGLGLGGLELLGITRYHAPFLKNPVLVHGIHGDSISFLGMKLHSEAMVGIHVQQMMDWEMTISLFQDAHGQFHSNAMQLGSMMAMMCLFIRLNHAWDQILADETHDKSCLHLIQIWKISITKFGQDVDFGGSDPIPFGSKNRWFDRNASKKTTSHNSIFFKSSRFMVLYFHTTIYGCFQK